MNNLMKAVRKRLSLSASVSGSSGMSQEASLVSKSLDDLRLAPYEENDGADMVFYCKLLGSEAVHDKNGSELGQFADGVIKSYSAGSTPTDGEGEAQQVQVPQQQVRRRTLSKNKTMIRVNAEGLELSTDGCTDKSTFKLCHVSFVSAAFCYSHCAAIICQSLSSPTGWRAYLLLFSKPKYAKRFAVFVAKQFDAGYEKWQSEQAEGTLDIAVEQEAIKLKSRLKRGITNRTFVLDDEDELPSSTKSQSKSSNSSDPDQEHGKVSQNGEVEGRMSSSDAAQSGIARTSSVAVREIRSPSKAVPARRVDSPMMPRNWNALHEPSQSVPQHLLDSRDGYNEFTHAEQGLRAMTSKKAQKEATASSSPDLDDVFTLSDPPVSWAANQDPFISLFEMRNANTDETSYSTNSLFTTQLSNGYRHIDDTKTSSDYSVPNQNFLLEL